jgi:hypothetical protein
MDREAYREIVDRVVAAERAEAERTGDECDSEPRPGASEADIAAAEGKLGKPLHPSHREFLLAHDGWRHFAWGMSLFGTAELTGEDYECALETRSYDEDLTGELEASIIIGASEDNASLVMITPGGEVVEHMYSEDERHPDLATFLDSRIAVLDEMRSSALAAIAATEREWDSEVRAAEDAELTAELRELLASRGELAPLPDPDAFVREGAEPVAVTDLAVVDEDGEPLVSIDLGFVLYLGAAPTADEVLACFRAWRRCFPVAGELRWQPASTMSFSLETSEDPDAEPFAETLRVDDQGHFGLRAQIETETGLYILNARGIPADTDDPDNPEPRASFVEVLVPPSESGPAVEACCRALAGALPVRSGYGGYFARSHDGSSDEAWQPIFERCRRFFGLEPCYVDGWLAGCRRRHCGAGWLTVLGRPFADALGDLDLSDRVARHRAGNGAVVLTCGELTCGDIARGELPVAVAEVARILEPISITEWSRHGHISMGGIWFSTHASQLPGGFSDHHATRAFMRRFVDPARFVGQTDREVALELIDRLKASMDDETVGTWRTTDDLDRLDGFRDVVRALFNGAYHAPERALTIEALEHAARFPNWCPAATYNNLLLRYFEDGRIDDAMAIMDAALHTAAGENNPHTYHNAACVLVKAGMLDEALDCVRRARDEGYPHMDLIAGDDDLLAIRDRPEFQRLIAGGDEEE